jgi:cytidyltransferase-like protein
MKRCTYGLVLGRFQPLHIGHMEYLQKAKEGCERLVIGITNPDTASLIDETADPKRSRTENNPFTYVLRYEMIDQSVRDSGWTPEQYIITPAFLTEPDEMIAFFPPKHQTTVFITIYDSWGEEKAKRLEQSGYHVEILWRRDMSQRITSGTDIRRLMRSGEKWEHLVPSGVAAHLRRSGLLSNSGRLG